MICVWFYLDESTPDVPSKFGRRTYGPHTTLTTLVLSIGFWSEPTDPETSVVQEEFL